MPDYQCRDVTQIWQDERVTSTSRSLPQTRSGPSLSIIGHNLAKGLVLGSFSECLRHSDVFRKDFILDASENHDLRLFICSRGGTLLLCSLGLAAWLSCSDQPCDCSLQNRPLRESGEMLQSDIYALLYSCSICLHIWAYLRVVGQRFCSAISPLSGCCLVSLVKELWSGVSRALL